MTGKYIIRNNPPHQCELPPKADVQAGDLWQCECGQYYFGKYDFDQDYCYWQWASDHKVRRMQQKYNNLYGK